MALPKITQPTFDCEIPTTKQKIKLRPMFVKEEKILLIAKQSDDRAEQLNAIKQVVNNCIVQPQIAVDDLAFVDIEYLFCKIRSQSISNKQKVQYKDNEDNQVYDFVIDLDKVEYKDNLDNKPIIQLTDNISITMRYPPAKLFTDSNFYQLDDQQMFDKLVTSCIVKIFEGDTVHDCKQSTEQELKEFIDQIPAIHYEKIQQFLTNTPTLYYCIEYTNSKQTKRTIELRTLDDFFTFG